MSLKASHDIHRRRDKALGVLELVAIALGGMIGGGIFAILGVCVSLIGAYTPFAIIVGGFLAVLAAYSYVKLGVYYKDEGATYSFYKRTFPSTRFGAALIAWWIVFGYISTLALYAYTFASYAISGFVFADSPWGRKLLAGGVIVFFTMVNVWSVKGMGKIEDLMVYTKLVILAVISFVLINNGQTSLPVLLQRDPPPSVIGILIAASITFVAYEGFQLVISAVNEMNSPQKNIPRAIYSSIFLAILIYTVMSLGAILAIPLEDLVQNKEYALAAGTGNILGNWGTDLVIIGALLATSSAISGTMFGASRLMAVIAGDGYLPMSLSKRQGHIPVAAVITMSVLAYLLVLIGSLELILEFGSITFLLVSVLMAYANFKIRRQTRSSVVLTALAFFGLLAGAGLILYYELVNQLHQMLAIAGLYLVLAMGAWGYARRSRQRATAHWHPDQSWHDPYRGPG